jgi:hypothetical protein
METFKRISITLAALLTVAATAATAQTPSTPIYVNGVLSSTAGTDVRVVATFHHINECSSPIGGLGKCAVHVHLSIANNQATALDFDPAGSSMSMNGVTVVQMDEKQVHSLGNSMMRHHWGNTGNQEFEDALTIRQTMLRRNTVQTGQTVAGELYFEIPKDQRKSFDPTNAHPTVLIQETTYQLQFRA